MGNIRESLGILLDNVPKDLDLNEMTAAIAAQPGVVSVHHLHAWGLTAGQNIVSTHVLVEPDHDREHIQQETQRLLKARFGIFFSTIQAETEICEEEEGARAIDFLRTGDEPESQMDHHGGHG